MDRRRRILAKYLALGCLLTAAVIWLERAGQLARWAEAVDPLIEALAGLGVAGVFLLGLLANSSVLLQVPYVVPILSAALAGADLPYLVALAVAAGVGATLGELVSYTLADLLLRRANLTGSRTYAWVRHTVRAHPRRTPWLVFAFALTMLPDDVLLLSLAMVGYGARRLILPLLLGKLGYTLGSAVLFHAVGQGAGALVSPSVTSDLAVIVLVLLVLVVLCQAELARAGSVGGQQVTEQQVTEQQGDDDGAQDPDRGARGLRSGIAHRGRGGGHQAPRGPG